MKFPLLMNADCLQATCVIPDGSVDLTVTSPPYDNLRTYNNSLTDWNRDKWRAILRQLFRVTVDGGVVVWVVADATIKGSETGTSFRQAIDAMEVGFNLHDTMVWAKPNPVPTQHTRYQAATEYMFVFSKGVPKTTNILREPSKSAGGVRKKHRAVGGGHDDNSDGSYRYAADKIRSNFWIIPVGASSSGEKHPAAFPLALATDHVLSWSNEGDIVLDPFLGSGTTGVACKNAGRNFIGIERDPEYFKIASDRIAAA